MDVLAKLGIEWKLLLAQVVNFLILLFVLRRYAYRPMLEFLEKRSKRIEQGLRDAKAAGEKLLSIEARERETLEKAREEASSVIARAREASEKVGAKILAESKAESERLLSEARKKLDGEREAMRAELKKELVGLVLLATEKVVGEKLKHAKDEDLVRDAVKNL